MWEQVFLQVGQKSRYGRGNLKMKHSSSVSCDNRLAIVKQFRKETVPGRVLARI